MDKKLIFTTGIAFLMGLLVGHEYGAKMFGYSSAEECILDGQSNRIRAEACYELYPPFND